jgi:hypothetical protein
MRCVLAHDEIGRPARRKSSITDLAIGLSDAIQKDHADEAKDLLAKVENASLDYSRSI